VLEEGKTYTAAPTTENGGAFYVNGGATLTGANVTFADNKATYGGAIYNAGTVNLDGAVTLKTETDTIYNQGTLNWNLTDGKVGVLNGYQNVTNSGKSAKLQLTVEKYEYAELPKEFVIATGDFSNIEGKDTFTVAGAETGAKTEVKIGSWAGVIDKMFARLTCADGQLKLTLSRQTVTVKPTEVVDATYKVYTNDVELTGTTMFVDTPAYVVYTAAEDYIFPNGQTVVTNYLDTSKDPAVNAEEPMQPVHMDYVAEVDGVQYTSFAKAYAAVDSASDDMTTLRLLKDIEAEETVKIEKNVKLDLNGWNYSGPKEGSFSVLGHTFEIIGTNTVSGAVTKDADGKVVIYGGVYDSDISEFLSGMCDVVEEGGKYRVVVKEGKQDPTPVLDKEGEPVGTIAVSNAALVAAGVTTNELNDVGRNDLKVWESIVLNLDPNDANSRVVAKHTQQLDENKLSVNVPVVPFGDATQVSEAKVVYELYGGDDKAVPVESWTKLAESTDPNFTIERKGYRYYAVIARVVIAEPVVMCTVTFDLNGGTWSQPTTYQVKKGEEFKIPSECPNRSGKEFLWWKGSDGTDWSEGWNVPIKKDMSFTACWADPQ